MRAHLLQHSEASPPGHLTQIFSELGSELKICRLDRGERLPALEDIDFLLSVGGEMHVGDTKEYPFLKREAKLIEKCLKAQKAYLGICLGAEMLADVLGARVYRGACHERGWPLIEVEGRRMNMFSNHHDLFDLPAGATRFATGLHCTNQGFVYQKNAIGIQFHPNSEKQIILEIARSKIKNPGPGTQAFEEISAGLVHLNDQHRWLKEFIASRFFGHPSADG
jgi:GMP synthase-like glutamine amidotransferase